MATANLKAREFYNSIKGRPKRLLILKTKEIYWLIPGSLFVRVRTRCSYAARALFVRCSRVVRALFVRCSYERELTRELRDAPVCPTPTSQ